jgi:hypothetical protein
MKCLQNIEKLRGFCSPLTGIGHAGCRRIGHVGFLRLDQSTPNR